MSNRIKRKTKKKLSHEDLINIITALRTQITNWKQISVSISADLLLVDPKNLMFLNENMTEEMMKQIISMASERLGFLLEEVYIKREITDIRVYKGEEGKTEEKTITTSLNSLAVLFDKYSILQKRFKELTKEQIDSNDGRLMMDAMEEELNKLYTFFTCRSPKVRQLTK